MHVRRAKHSRQADVSSVACRVSESLCSLHLRLPTIQAAHSMPFRCCNHGWEDSPTLLAAWYPFPGLARRRLLSQFLHEHEGLKPSLGREPKSEVHRFQWPHFEPIRNASPRKHKFNPLNQSTAPSSNPHACHPDSPLFSLSQ